MPNSRTRFEAWVSAPPYERSVERQGEKGTWPGQYRAYETQAAWEAWQESARQQRVACAQMCLAQQNVTVANHPARVVVTHDVANTMAQKCAAMIYAMEED